MATTATTLYGSTTAITLTLTSLASDAALLAGRQSTVLSNVTDDAVDALLGGTFRPSTTTAPAAGSKVELWAYGNISNSSTNYSSAGTGVTDANFSPTNTAVKAQMKLLSSIGISTAAANVVYTVGPFSIAQAFGGTLPTRWGIYVVHNTGAALSAVAADFSFAYTPLNYQSS